MASPIRNGFAWGRGMLGGPGSLERRVKGVGDSAQVALSDVGMDLSAIAVCCGQDVPIMRSANVRHKSGADGERGLSRSIAQRLPPIMRTGTDASAALPKKPIAPTIPSLACGRYAPPASKRASA